MNLIIFGPQGSGKGTQAELIAKKFGLTQLETGKILRKIVSEDSPLGHEIAAIINSGKLVPDETMFKLIRAALNKVDYKLGFIMDGTPRTIDQAVWLDNELAKDHTQIDKLIFLQISNEEAVKRLGSRMMCPQCGRIYNLLTVPPKNGEICDDDQTQLVRRADETPEAINKRLDEYHRATAPVVDYYRQKGKVIEINGQQPIETIFEEIVKKLEINN